MKIEHSEKNLLMRIANGFRASRGIRKNLDGEALVELANQTVESKPEQEKTVEITENGTTEIAADEGYALSKVITNVNVPSLSKLPQVLDDTPVELTAEDLEGVTNIREYAFHRCNGLISITIPDSATIVYNEAFYMCTHLRNVTIGNGVTSIGLNAFRYCEKITSMTIGTGIQTIAGGALKIGSSDYLATITFLGTTPPTIATNTFNIYSIDKIIVPAGYGDVYRNATNWADLADYIEEAAV